jgi:hypothetical protein
MKKKLLYFCLINLWILIPSKSSFGQVVATWVLNADQTGTASGTDASSIVVANQALTGLEIKNYQAITTPTTGYNSGLSVTGQRVLPTVLSGWPGGESAQVSTRYVEYSVSPIAGKILTVTGVSIDFGDSGSTNTMKANIYYSTDGFATQNTLQSAFLLPKFSAAETWTQYSNSSLSIPVSESNSLKLRIYPWYSSTASTSKYLVQSNVKITGTISTASTQPLDFLSLAGKADALGKTVDLNWSTTNEVNTKNFEIQKRTDADSFVTIGSIASKNTAGVHAYSFTDQSASSGTAYYRVLQFDNDGSSKSSSVIAVTSKTATKLSVYPNPAEQTLNVNHPLSSNKANFSVLSLDGKIMLKKAVAANSTSSMLDVSSLASGAYMVILDDQNQKSSIKFIKK